MKNLCWMLLGASLLTACSPAAKMEISGTLNGIESDTLLVNHRSVDGGEARLDTVPMLNGQFAFNVGDSVLKQVYIYAKPSGNGAVSMKALGLVLLPGRPVTVSGTLDDYRLSGDAFYEACNELNEQLRPCITKLDSLSKVCMQMEVDGIPADSIRRAYAPSREFLNCMQDLRCDFIRSHADQAVAVYALSRDLSVEKIGEMLDVVAEPVRTGVMAPLYRQVKDGYDKEMARRAAAESASKQAAALEAEARQRIQIQRAQEEQHEDMSKYRTEKADANGGGANINTQAAPQEPVRAEKRVGRNDPCPCGSGKKYKNCHGAGL